MSYFDLERRALIVFIHAWDVQPSELCWAAVVSDPANLQYIRAQTPEICLYTVERDGLMLEHVRAQTPEICRAAIAQNPIAAKFVKIDL